MRDSRRRPASEDPDGEYSHSAVRNAAVLTATGSVRVRLLLASSRLLGFGPGRRARTWRGGLGASRSSSSHSVDGCSWAVPVGRLRVWASVAAGCCGSVHRRTSRDAGSGGCFGACAQPKGLCFDGHEELRHASSRSERRVVRPAAWKWARASSSEPGKIFCAESFLDSVQHLQTWQEAKRHCAAGRAQVFPQPGECGTARTAAADGFPPALSARAVARRS